MNTSIKNIAVFTLGLLSVLSSCGGDFLDNKPTDAVDSGIVPVPSNAGRIFNGAWYNLFEYSFPYIRFASTLYLMQANLYPNNTITPVMTIITTELISLSHSPFCAMSTTIFIRNASITENIANVMLIPNMEP